LKFLKGVGAYILAFIACMFVVTTALREWPDGLQMLFAFGMPGLISWWWTRRSPPKDAATPSYRSNQDNAELVRVGGAARIEPDGAGQQRIGETKAFVSAGKQIPMRAPRTDIPTSYRTSHKQGWVPKGEAVIIAGRTVDGLVYIGSAPSVDGRGYGERCRAYIDPALSAPSSASDHSGEGMPYWPGYSSIPAACRATYLDWLADGARNGTVNPGYMFLYFYGLERRFLVDKPADAEKHTILAEVCRLREIFSSNHSAQRYLGDFIDLASILMDDANFKKPVFKSWNWDLPLSLKVTLGGMIANDIPLTAEWLLSWFLCHPEKRLRTPAHRCDEEFRALFTAKFELNFPNGLKVAKSKKVLKYNYRAASGEFGGDIPISANGRPVLDISGLTKPVKVGQQIADEAMDELDKLSRFLGRNPERKGSFEAHALLPACLWQQFPSQQRNELIAWAKGIVALGGIAPVDDVLKRTGSVSSVKLSKRQLTDVADALAGLGFGLAPDPRHALRLPKEGEPVVIFETGDGYSADAISEAYRETLTELALSAFVAQADGHVTESERRVLSERVHQAKHLTDGERKHLKANLDWFLAVPADMTTLRSRLKHIDKDQQTALRTAMIAVAHADGIIRTEEVAGIEKIYRILGLDPATVYSDLHAGEVADAPVRVKPAEPGVAGEAIPDESPITKPVLDASRIAAIRSDTERVSSVLGQIFQGEPDIEPEPTTTASPISGLDVKCAALVREVITKGHWSSEAFEELALRHGLMASGALEVINEWSFATYDEALLDEYDGYDVTNEIAQTLKTQFEKVAA
jgi:tellurite resistance protein